MKKMIAFTALILCCSGTAVLAQGADQQRDPAARLEMMKQRIKPQLVEKTKITDAQADKVLEIQLWAQEQRRGLREMSEDQRNVKIKETNDEKEKKMKAIPLTDEQIKAVNDFYEEMMKNRPRPGGGGK